MKPSYEELEQKLAESQREFRAADATIENLQMQLNAEREAKLALAAENAGLKDLARGWANATDDRLFEEHGEIFHDSIDACEEELKTICPATDAFLAEVQAQGQSEVIEWLDAEITAIDTMYRGDPSYEHDAYWMKSEVLDVVKLARKAFAAQLRRGVQS